MSRARSPDSTGVVADILVIEDDPKMARIYETVLDAEGYRFFGATNGQRALEQVRTRSLDLIVLDLGLPDVDGLSLLPAVRENTNVPVIVVSAREQEPDKVRALDSGATDYLVKPFSVPELLARVRVGLRNHAAAGTKATAIITFGDFRLDLEQRLFRRGDKHIRLSPTEFKLLATLARHADQIVTTSSLLKETWGSAYMSRRNGYVRVYMHALRQKIEDDPTRPRHLVNEAGIGYRLRIDPDDNP